MVAINKHSGSDDPSTGKFDHVAQAIQDIRELRDRHDREKQERHTSRFSPARLVRSAKVDIPLEEALPLFLSTPDNQDSQSTDQDAPHQDPEHQDSLHQEEASERDCLDQAAECQKPSDQETGHQDEPRHQDVRHQNSRLRDGWHQEGWQQAALESDRERMDADVSSTITKTTVKKSILAASVLFALVALFMLEDPRTLIADASASLTAVLPKMSSRGGPAPAPEKTAATPSAPVAAVTVAPTREAIAAAYQTALQGQPTTAPPPNPADPDEAATLQKRAHDGDVLFKQFQAWEAAQSAKAAGRAAQ
jgi:hypothetical protein